MTYERISPDKCVVKEIKEDDKRKLMEGMQENIPNIEEILSKYGKLLKNDFGMWNLGYCWFMKLKCRSPIYMRIDYSDRRFAIVARKGKDLKSSDVLQTNDAYELCNFQQWVCLQDLEKELSTFQKLFLPEEKEVEEE